MEDIFKKLGDEYLGLERDLCAFLDKINTEALLPIMMTNLLMRAPEELAGDKFGYYPVMFELLAFHAITRFGENTDVAITPWDTKQCFDLLEKCIFRRAFSKSSGLSEIKTSDVGSLASSMRMHSNIVRGSAYPEQTRQEILEIQGAFDSWFINNIGISPTRAVEILFALIRHTERIFNKYSDEYFGLADSFKNRYVEASRRKIPTDEDKQLLMMFKDEASASAFGYTSAVNAIVPLKLPVTITELDTDMRPTEIEEIALKSLIGVSKDTISSIESSQNIQEHPLYILSDGRVLMSDLSNCLDFLWEAFETRAKLDKRFYDKQYQKRKARWLETKAVEYFGRIFPSHSIYQCLDYPDPEKTSGATAELDIAISWGPFLILVEAKAKQFRIESLRGNPSKLWLDIKQNVEDSHKQALRAIKYIKSKGSGKFIERATGRKLSIKSNIPLKIYTISLSLHHLGMVSTELNKTKELGLFKESEFPFSISIADLDTITRTIIVPEALLHFIERRIAILNDHKEWHGDDLDFFSAYLDTRLLMGNLQVPKEEKMDALFISGYSDKFDRFFMYERGEMDSAPDIALRLPERTQAIFDELKSRGDDSSKRIAFALLDIEDSLLASLAEAIFEIKGANIKHGMLRRCSFSNDEIVVSIVGGRFDSPEELERGLAFRVYAEKYRRKLGKSIGFGLFCDTAFL